MPVQGMDNAWIRKNGQFAENNTREGDGEGCGCDDANSLGVIPLCVGLTGVLLSCTWCLTPGGLHTFGNAEQENTLRHI